MFQLFSSSLKRLFRNKFNIFWILLFPIALGTFFNIAFSNLSAAESYKAIGVAVICKDNEYGDALKETTKALSKGDNALLSVTYCDEKEAMKLLEAKDITGIIYSGNPATLTISQNMPNEALNQSILQAFVDEYNLRSDIIVEVLRSHPENMETVVKEMDITKSYNTEVVLQKNPNVDTYLQYFYNQIAMACLYAGMAGIIVATENQGNQSALAARKNISSTRKSATIFFELLAAVVFEFLMNTVGYLYDTFILKIEGLDSQFPLALLTIFVGVFSGVSLGYFIGALGKRGKNEKAGILFAVTMPLCFFSGLMVGNMRMIIDEYIPIINKINPAALIADSFYCLSIFEGHERYTQNMFCLLLISLILIGSGLLFTRRSRYASI